jgi:hypothetical protein
MRIAITIVDVVKGGHRGKKQVIGETSMRDLDVIDIETFCKKSKYVEVLKKSNYCLVQAIAIAKAYVDRETLASKLKKSPVKLMKIVNTIVSELKLPNEHLGISHIRQIEKYLKDYSIVVYSSGDRSQDPVYFDKQNIKRKFLYLLHHKDHFWVITKIKAFFNCSYYCDYHQVAYSNIGRHKCEHMCKTCFQTNCEMQTIQKCKCGVEARNKTCLEKHQELACIKSKICGVCNSLKVNKQHVCVNEKYCFNCKKPVDQEHRCYILTDDQIKLRDKNKKNSEFSGFVFFDFETYVCRTTGDHVVNMAMAQKVCSGCINDSKRCQSCDKKIIKYNISEFVDWMLSKENNNYIFIAHNAKGFDAQFIINEFQKRLIPTDQEMNVTLEGTKLLGVKFRKIWIKDSSLFIPMRLEQFPKAFGLTELKKGFFPYAFNDPCNINYVGAIPEKKYFAHDMMSEPKRKEFEKWYESVKDKPYNFKEELEAYCWSDIQLLSAGCLAYSRANIIGSKRDENDPGICPFREKLTLASYCNLLFTRNYMPANKIAMMPACGYNAKSNMSRECDQWLKYLSETENINISHALNGGEKKIGNFYVDGYCEENKTIYDYHGCIFHGCCICYEDKTFNPILQCKNSTLFNRTVKRAEKIRELKPDYKYVEMWSHDWYELKKNSDIVEILKKYEAAQPLYARDALFGGRTNALKLYHKCRPGEKIRYIDYTSLYPSCQKYCKYPVGHPKIITENFDQKENYFGLIKCALLPPRRMYIPLLPFRSNGKLLFPLCRTCAETQNQSKCTHSDAERILTGTYVTLEVDQALKEGYKMVKIYEIWDFEEQEQYDPVTKTGGIFTSYLNAAMKKSKKLQDFLSNVKQKKKKKHI